MARRTNVVPKEMETIKQRFHYNPGVRAGNLLFIAGQVGRDANLNVVEMVTYHTDMRDLQLFIAVKDRYYTGEYPAWTGVGVTALAMPGLMVEIKCVAMLKD